MVYGRPPHSSTKFVPGETLAVTVAQDLMDQDEVGSRFNGSRWSFKEIKISFVDSTKSDGTLH